MHEICLEFSQETRKIKSLKLFEIRSAGPLQTRGEGSADFVAELRCFQVPPFKSFKCTQIQQVLKNLKNQVQFFLNKKLDFLQAPCGAC